ncbi:MAG TPA: hypothetical protein VL485_21650 [Ktedonobacteraceae bacterium]|jgi:hypothetical protein|nr:hypothetical protein [Ktedonobacteraceae bacterium]
MMRFIVSALSQDQKGPVSHFTLAVSVFDSSNGLGIQNLNVGNFIVHDMTSGVPFSVVEVHTAGLPGFYRLLLKTDMTVNAGDYILAVVVTIQQRLAGHVSGGIEEGNTLVKVKVV